MNVHFQCVIQVCRFNCPEPVCPDSDGSGPLDSYNSPAQGAVESYSSPVQGAVDSYSVQASPGLPTYGQTPTLDTYAQPQASYIQQPQVASYTQSPPVALPQDTYNGQFTAPQGPPPPPAGYVEPRTPGSASAVPVVGGYEGPARRRSSNGPPRARLRS
jgi:hypothetical protein